MLENYLIRSKIRKDLLKLFFTGDKDRYYVRDLERLSGHSAGSIHRELSRFTTDKLLFKEKSGNNVNYYLNRKHALYDEVSRIILKAAGIKARSGSGTASGKAGTASEPQAQKRKKPAPKTGGRSGSTDSDRFLL